MRKKIFLFSIIILCFALFVFRFVSLNNEYPAPVLKNYNTNQIIPYGQFVMKVNSYYFLDTEMVKSTFNEELNAGQNLKCVIVNINVKNVGKSEKNVELYPFVLESGAWKNGINLNAFKKINRDNKNATLEPTLKPEESLSIKLPFTMIDKHFKLKQWKIVESRKYSLVLSLYPTKRIISL